MPVCTGSVGSEAMGLIPHLEAGQKGGESGPPTETGLAVSLDDELRLTCRRGTEGPAGSNRPGEGVLPSYGQWDWSLYLSRNLPSIFLPPITDLEPSGSGNTLVWARQAQVLTCGLVVT